MPIQQRSAQTRSSYEQLRRQLLHGQLAPGARLIEEKWAEILGVNRSALRESLSILAHEGLLEVGPHGGFFVPDLDEGALSEVLEVRLSLEVGALQILEIRQSIPEEGLQQLTAACNLMEQLLNAGFEYGFVEADRKFHDILVEMAGNARLLRIYRQAPLPLSPLNEPDEAARLQNMTGTLRDHRQLCQLLQEGNLTAARAALRTHLLLSHRTLRTTLGTD